MNKTAINNCNGELLTYKQAAERFNLGINTTMKLAKESGALRKIGRIARIDRAVFAEYIKANFGGE